MNYLLVLLISVSPAFANPPLPCPHPHRSEASKHAFVKTHPCPATGLNSIHCPGYVIDHIIALACCGPDEASNMQWQTIADGHAKDRVELLNCQVPK